MDLVGVRGTLYRDGKKIDKPLWLPIPGLHMAYPALFAVAAALDLGLPLEATLASLATCTPAKHRMQVVARGGVTVLDDCYNANPSSTEALLAFVAGLAHPGRKVLVLGDMLELGQLASSSHRAIVERVLAERGFARAYLVGPLYQKAVVEQSAAKNPKLALFPSVVSLAGELARELAPGDLLVLKGSRGIALETLIEKL